MGVLFKIRSTKEVEPMSYRSFADLRTSTAGSIVRSEPGQSPGTIATRTDKVGGAPLWKMEHGVQNPSTVKNVARKLQQINSQCDNFTRIRDLYQKASEIGSYVER